MLKFRILHCILTSDLLRKHSILFKQNSKNMSYVGQIIRKQDTLGLLYKVCITRVVVCATTLLTATATNTDSDSKTWRIVGFLKKGCQNQ